MVLVAAGSPSEVHRHCLVAMRKQWEVWPVFQLWSDTNQAIEIFATRVPSGRRRLTQFNRPNLLDIEVDCWHWNYPPRAMSRKLYPGSPAIRVSHGYRAMDSNQYLE